MVVLGCVSRWWWGGVGRWWLVGWCRQVVVSGVEGGVGRWWSVDDGGGGAGWWLLVGRLLIVRLICRGERACRERRECISVLYMYYILYNNKISKIWENTKMPLM
ncbi:hypothetical protein HanIR_Chr08g0363401 [Helianthus annuus]|nr:hypothetical protein HanIR_Chr08g0363401 [Helianthus annuus]